MAVVVFDADVLIGYLNHADAHHRRAVERVRLALDPGTRRVISAVTYTELLIGPLRAAGAAGADTVDRMLARLGIETIPIDTELARHAAAVRAQTKLTLPDAFAVATALDVEKGGHENVRLESFDGDVIKTYAELGPSAV